MTNTYAIEAENLTKHFKNFTLDIPKLQIPQGFATALIGENGAGKTTLLNILSGIRLDHKGMLSYFGGAAEELAIEGNCADGVPVKERIGYLGDHQYYLPHWKPSQIRELMGILFDSFRPERFDTLLRELNVEERKVKELSDGNRMKLMLAGVFARETELLLLDEPASPLDPLMRERLNDMIRSYIAEGAGRRSVFFSTHNISDMESVTDYAIIMEHGRIVEAGAVEDLKEKYVLVKGNRDDLMQVQQHLFTKSENQFGFEGMVLAKDLPQIMTADLVTETPNLFRISVAVMRHYSQLGGAMTQTEAAG